MTRLFKRFKDASLNDKLLFVVLLVFSVFLFLAFLLSAFRSLVNADAGYYLGVTELIHQGYVPYRDFSLGYTPLFFYVLQLPRMLMGAYPDYVGYMLFLYLFSVLDALLLSSLIKRISNSQILAWLSAVVFLVLYLYLDGAYFILETFSLFCGLVSMTLLVGRDKSFWRCVFSGVFSAFAFLSKQYGLLFAGFIGVLLLLSNEEGWKSRLLSCFYAFIGFCAILILFASLFALSGLGMNDLLSALSGSSYGGQSLGMYGDGVIKTFRLFPYLLFVPCVFWGIGKKEKNLLWACCVGLFLASIQFYFNVFPHYYIFMLPFVLVLNAIIWKRLKHKVETPALFLLYFGFLFTSCAIPMQNVYKDTKSLVKHDIRAAQKETTIQLRRTVTEHELDSALCYWNKIQYYGLCPIKPAAIVDYGFSFGGDTEDTYTERLREADCFIVDKNDLDDIAEMEVLSRVLSDRFIILDQTFADGTRVFVKKHGEDGTD